MEIIFAAVVSVIAQLIKKWAGTTEYYTIGIVVVLSLLGAVVYMLLKSYGLWEAFLQILVYAGAIYAYIISRFPNAGNTR